LQPVTKFAFDGTLSSYVLPQGINSLMYCYTSTGPIHMRQNYAWLNSVKFCLSHQQCQ